MYQVSTLEGLERVSEGVSQEKGSMDGNIRQEDKMDVKFINNNNNDDLSIYSCTQSQKVENTQTNYK